MICTFVHKTDETRDQAPEVPTGLKDFLKYCGASQAGMHCTLVVDICMRFSLRDCFTMCLHLVVLRNVLYRWQCN